MWIKIKPRLEGGGFITNPVVNIIRLCRNMVFLEENIGFLKFALSAKIELCFVVVADLALKRLFPGSFCCPVIR